MHDQHKISVNQWRDRHQVAHELILFVGEERLVDGLGARDHQQRVAIGRRLGDDLGANGGAGARTVFHDKGSGAGTCAIPRAIARA